MSINSMLGHISQEDAPLKPFNILSSTVQEQNKRQRLKQQQNNREDKENVKQSFTSFWL